MPPCKGKAFAYSLKMIRNNIPPIFALLLITCLVFGNTVVVAQQRLSPQQEETVRQLKEQLIRNGDGVCFIRDSNMGKTETIEVQFKNIDPILVGKNVVFSKNWLKHIGPNNKLTRQQLEQYRTRIDRIYDCYEKLTGGPPKGGKKVFIDVFKFTLPHHNGAAHAHRNNVNCFSEQAVDGGSREVQDGSWAAGMMHELGHTFSFGREWDVAAETSACFMPCYGLENAGMWWGMRETPSYCSGIQERKQKFSEALAAFQRNSRTMETFHSARSTDFGTVWDFYPYGLVYNVGWRPYEKAFQSYRDNPPQYADNIVGEERRKAQAREFLERIAKFSGKPNVLRSLPDKGELFDKHFTSYTIDDIVAKLFPGWTIKNCKVDDPMGPGKHDNYRGKRNILMTHPLSQKVPCTLERRIDIPADKKTVLRVVVSHHPNADWELVCRVNGAVHRVVTIDEKLTKGGWATGTFDLTPFAGRKNVRIELENKANGWYCEAGYWASLTIQSR